MNTSNPTSSAGGYVPGVCNINSAEVAYRRKAGYTMLAITVAVAIIVFALGALLDVSPIIRLAIFFPAFITTVCFLQVKYKFCVNYGASGKQNATEGDKEAQAIVDAAAKKLDLERTRKIKLQGALIAAVVTLLLVLIPV